MQLHEWKVDLPVSTPQVYFPRSCSNSCLATMTNPDSLFCPYLLWVSGHGNEVKSTQGSPTALAVTPVLPFNTTTVSKGLEKSIDRWTSQQETGTMRELVFGQAAETQFEFAATTAGFSPKRNGIARPSVQHLRSIDDKQKSC